MHGIDTAVVPIMVGVLKVVSKRFGWYFKGLGLPDMPGELQTSAIVGTTSIIHDIQPTVFHQWAQYLAHDFGLVLHDLFPKTEQHLFRDDT